MRAIRIYSPFAETATLGAKIPLSEEAAHHLLRVLRFKNGGKFEVFNGLGKIYLAKLENKGKEAWAELQQELPALPESSLHLHLFQAIIKNEKMDWVVQKAVELGVKEITPIITEYTDIRFTQEKQAKKMAHWQAIMTHACEQSQRVYLPRLHEPLNFTQAIESSSSYKHRVLLHPYRPTLPNNAVNIKELALYIGPEGGFHEKEVMLAENAGFSFLNLGLRILRAETAATVGISLFQAKFGDLAFSL